MSLMKQNNHYYNLLRPYKSDRTLLKSYYPKSFFTTKNNIWQNTIYNKLCNDWLQTKKQREQTNCRASHSATLPNNQH